MIEYIHPFHLKAIMAYARDKRGETFRQMQTIRNGCAAMHVWQKMPVLFFEDNYKVALAAGQRVGRAVCIAATQDSKRLEAEAAELLQRMCPPINRHDEVEAALNDIALDPRYYVP